MSVHATNVGTSNIPVSERAGALLTDFISLLKAKHKKLSALATRQVQPVSQFEQSLLADFTDIVVKATTGEIKEASRDAATEGAWEEEEAEEAAAASEGAEKKMAAGISHFATADAPSRGQKRKHGASDSGTLTPRHIRRGREPLNFEPVYNQLYYVGTISYC
jgi:hypothetical protein